MLRCLPFALIAAFVSTAALAWEEPARGSDLRREILNTVRVVAALDLSAPIEFIVRELRYAEGLAFASVQPQRPGGVPITWDSTRLAAKGESADWYDGTAMHVFLFRLDGHWYIRDYSVGATDVWWHGGPLCETYRAVVPEYCQ